MNIKVGRYSKNEGTLDWVKDGEAAYQAWLDEPTDSRPEYVIRDGQAFIGDRLIANIRQHHQGWVEDAEKTWIAFIDMDGHPQVFLNRCVRGCGAVVENEGEFCGGDFKHGPPIGQPHPAIPHVINPGLQHDSRGGVIPIGGVAEHV